MVESAKVLLLGLLGFAEKVFGFNVLKVLIVPFVTPNSKMSGNRTGQWGYVAEVCDATGDSVKNKCLRPKFYL